MDRADVAAALDAMRYTTAQSAQVGTCVLGPLTKTVFVVADDHATIVELCRQQHEALQTLMIGVCACGVPHDGERAVLREAVEMVRPVLALWPDGGE